MCDEYIATNLTTCMCMMGMGELHFDSFIIYKIQACLDVKIVMFHHDWRLLSVFHDADLVDGNLQIWSLAYVERAGNNSSPIRKSLNVAHQPFTSLLLRMP